MRRCLCQPLAESTGPLFEEILEEIIINVNTALAGGQLVFAKTDSGLNLTVIQTILIEIHQKRTFLVDISLNLCLTNKMTEHLMLFLSFFIYLYDK